MTDVGVGEGGNHLVLMISARPATQPWLYLRSQRFFLMILYFYIKSDQRSLLTLVTTLSCHLNPQLYRGKFGGISGDSCISTLIVRFVEINIFPWKSYQYSIKFCSKSEIDRGKSLMNLQIDIRKSSSSSSPLSWPAG